MERTIRSLAVFVGCVSGVGLSLMLSLKAIVDYALVLAVLVVMHYATRIPVVSEATRDSLATVTDRDQEMDGDIC
jgi:hypothetical protein